MVKLCPRRSGNAQMNVDCSGGGMVGFQNEKLQTWKCQHAASNVDCRPRKPIYGKTFRQVENLECLFIGFENVKQLGE